MPAPTFTRPVQGAAPNQFVQNSRDEASINEALQQLWLAIAAGEGEEQVALVLNAALSALSDADRAEVARDDAQGVLPDRLRRDVGALIADGDLTYTPAQPGTVTENDIIRTRAEGFSYRVLASGATDADVTTAGGVKLRVNLTPDGSVPALAYGSDGAAIQKAVDRANANGGGRVVCAPQTFESTAPIVLPSRVVLDLAGGIIEQQTDGVLIVDPTGTPGVTSRWQILNGRLNYANQQTAIGGSGIRLAKSGVVTSNWLIENVSIANAYHGVYVAAGASTFLGEMSNVTATSSDNFAFFFGAGASVHTNIKMTNVWALQPEGSERPGGRGFSLSNIQELSGDNLAVDGAQGAPFAFASCTGKITNMAIERCARTITTGGVGASVLASQSRLSVGTVLATGNDVTLTGSSSFAIVRAQDASVLVIDHITDNDTDLTIATGDYWTLQAADAGSVIRNISATSTGTSPSIATSDESPNVPARIREIGGATHLINLGGVRIAAKSSIPSTLDFPDASFVINSAPAAGGPLGWRRVGSAWFAVSDTPTATTFELASIGSTINTAGKYQGRQVLNTDTNKLAIAGGSAASNVWRDAQGVTIHTPS